MKGLAISTDNKAQFKDFGDPIYKSAGAEVGGLIEIVHPKYLPEEFCMVVNEEGLLQKLPLNLLGSVLYGTLEHGHPIVGNIVIFREGFINEEYDFVDMTESDQCVLESLVDSIKNFII